MHIATKMLPVHLQWIFIRKSIGSDDVYSQFPKTMAPLISNPLSSLFNLFFEVVFRLRGYKHKCSNCRAVSFTSIACNALENVNNDAIFLSLSIYDLLTDVQNSFVTKRSPFRYLIYAQQNISFHPNNRHGFPWSIGSFKCRKYHMQLVKQEKASMLIWMTALPSYRLIEVNVFFHLLFLLCKWPVIVHYLKRLHVRKWRHAIFSVQRHWSLTGQSLEEMDMDRKQI